MTKFIIPPFQKRFFLALLLIAVLAYLFWTGSRYPSLDEKAVMSGAIQLEDSLSFEAKFAVDAGMGLAERIFWTTLNWIDTNLKGMTFGVLFAAAFLTALSYLRTKSFRGGFSNALLGMVIGTPLGVCVNCAAPIARGMYTGGLRAETTLAAMIASPTLNVVVLTMLFSLLPVYMALTKIAFSLVVILLAVPLICRTLPRREIAPGPAISLPTQDWTLGAALTQSARAADDARPEHVVKAARAVIGSYLRNLWYILRMTVPLMLLAGLLGATAATLLPQGLILGLEFSLLALLAIAVVGLFLPVPIAFDVVVTGALLTAGLEQGYVMALLFTLGSFSVYSFFIVAQAMGGRAAWMMAGAVLALGVVAGLGAQGYHTWQSDRALRMLLGDARPSAHMPWAAQAATTTADPEPQITVTTTPFAARSPADATPFTRIEALQVGIDKPLEFSFADMWPPFWEGRSLASGDIDRDGDLDLVVASTEAGLYLYENDGTGQFSRVALDLGPLTRLPVFNAVLADVDNDGWRDLILATYREGNFVWRNRLGQFAGAPTRIAMPDDHVLSLALSLADADRDGDLDLALGNWAAGWYRRVPGEESRNAILWNDAASGGGTFGTRTTALPGIPGETLSILFSDIDGNGTADLLVGNDFEVPDYVYLGDGAGGFTAITHADARLPHTTTTTMSIKTADLLNDGTPDLYFAQIAGRSSGVSDTLKMQPLSHYCDAIADAQAKATCAANMDIKHWYKSGNQFDPTYAGKCQTLAGRAQAECKAMLVKDLAIQRNDAAICRLIPLGEPRARSYCDLHFLPARPITAAESDAAVPQILRSNVLLEREGDGDSYTDTAEARGLEVGGWSWDTKIADFDNDGWQDVYIVNGTWVPNEVSPSNLFFHNNGDGTFTEASGPFGLEDYLMTAAATAFDIDNDGDLDMVTHPVNGPLVLFRNAGQTGRAIAFELRDHVGNRDGIGARLRLADDSPRIQSREIVLGGGFMSFDAPRVHFGLGDQDAATRAEITWPDGQTTVIDGPLQAGALYTVTRR